jgi:hypothetical protein
VVVMPQAPEVVEGYHLQVWPRENVGQLLANGFEDANSRQLLDALGEGFRIECLSRAHLLELHYVFKDIQVTLYDFFGYLLPGSVVVLAVVVGFWAVFWPHSSLLVPLQLPALAATFLSFAAYLAGHLAQAMANIAESWSRASKRFDEKIPLSTELEKWLRESTARHLGEPAGKLTAKELYLLCDQTLIHNHSMGEREIFIYREGFYRGNSVALAALTVSMCVRLLCSPAVFVIGQRTTELHRNHIALAAALTALGAWLAYRRYLRFREYKYQTCFLRFLSLWTPSPSMEKKKDGST